MTRLSISLLGPFHITLDSAPITDFATDKARALLAYLAVEADHPHRRETLSGLLWPDQPERRANQSLRQALLYLRQALGDAATFLCATRETIQFNRNSPYLLDVAAFASLIEACQRHRHRRMEICRPCLNRLEQAIELYRGEFLEQFFLSDSSAFEEWALLKREWLHRQVVEALSCLADYYERRGEYGRAREYAWRQIALEPWCEEAHRQIMRLLVFDGQRTAALAQYENCRRMLSQELGLEPTADTVALYERIRAGENLAVAQMRNLPTSPTPFVGRQEELAELAELLASPDCRLITLVGPGGIGKSRLALQAAAEHLGAFAHGVYFVPLAAVSSPHQMVPAIADALGYPFTEHHDPREQLLSYLRERQPEVLLMLDNMEHILQGSELLAEILGRAPGVKLLVASRERLALQEEWVYQVEGLTYPQDPTLCSGDPGGRLYSAIDLFRQRAGQAQRRFAFEAEAPHVARICQLVEGMPLGIELAAAWVTARSCAEIAREIERNLDILTTTLRNVPERHRSMRATLDYSWSLLAEPERQVLARLCVFRGGFQPEAAGQVAGATLPILSALADKSLLRRETSGRFEMHELVRQYAAEKLGDAVAQVQDQHCRYYAAFLHRREQALHGEGQKEAMQTIHAEIENVRAAWKWAIAQQMDEAIDQSLEGLHWFYDTRSWFDEAQEAFGRAAEAVAASPDHDGKNRLLGRLGVCQGGAYFRLGRYEQSRELIQKSIAIFRQLDERAELAFALIALGHVALYQRGRDNAQQCYEESLALHRQIGHARGMVEALNGLGVVLRERGQYAEATQSLEQALTLARQINNRWRISFTLNNLGIVARMMGDYQAAKAYYQESLKLKQEFGDSRGAAISLNDLGNIACALEEYKEALKLHQESMALCKEIGDRMGVARSLNNLGMVAHEQGRYSEARRYHEESLALKLEINDQRGAIHSFNHLGKALAELGEPGPAAQYFRRALKSAMEMQAMPLALDALERMAELLVKQRQVERAAELLTLVRRHPASEQRTKDQADRWLADLAFAAPQGKPRSLDAVVSELLAE